MHSEHERYCGLGMNALVCIYSGNRNVIMFEHGCSGCRMHWEHERYCGLGMNALVIMCSGNTNVIYYGLGMDALGTVCSGNMNVINYGSGMNALVIGCTRNTNVSIPLPQTPQPQSSETLQNRVRKCPRLLKHERCYGLSMDALVIRCNEK